jgi:iron(III) transport system ATP-binding protein
MSASPYLSLTHLHKAFGNFVALQDINLDIVPGELVCFLGPSGCGKTTLLRIIAGLEVQTRGLILQAGKDISSAHPAERDYGIVFQSYALFPNLSIADNVAYGLVNRKIARDAIQKRVQELLTLVGLPGSGNKYPSQLSGGQQQRIALARALATSPGLLLLDEPLSALDALERVRLREEIRSLQQSLGVTTIMVTHDQEEALSMADRIVVMNHGCIEQVGTPTEIYREPASAFVADFVGQVNVLHGTVTGQNLQLGEMQIALSDISDKAKTKDQGKVKVYLRPEDVLARPIMAGDACVFQATIQEVEFLGAFCHVHVLAPAISSQTLTVYLSLNYLAEQKLQAGSTLALKLLPERIKLF